MCKSAIVCHVLYLHTFLDASILVLDGSAAFPFSFLLDTCALAFVMVRSLQAQSPISHYTVM